MRRGPISFSPGPHGRALSHALSLSVCFNSFSKDYLGRASSRLSLVARLTRCPRWVGLLTACSVVAALAAWSWRDPERPPSTHPFIPELYRRGMVNDTQAGPLPCASKGASSFVSPSTPSLAPVPGIRDDEFEMEVALVTVFRGETPYLEEWLEYHLLVGVQHFFMVTNDCEPEEAAASRRVLEPYIATGTVALNTAFKCSEKFQLEAYQKAYDTLTVARRAKWIGFLDIDEYFVPVDPAMTVGDVLAQYRGDRAASVHFNRLFFGPNGHRTRPDMSVLAAYTTHVNPFIRLHDDLRLHRGKSFFRAGLCASVRIHSCETPVTASPPIVPAISASKVPWDYYAYRNGSRIRVLAEIPPFGLALDGAWIAHYYTKSYDEYDAKNEKGAADRKRSQLRAYTSIPNGTEDVTNTFVARSVAARLEAAPSSQFADRRDAARNVLLHNAPSSAQLLALETTAAASPVVLDAEQSCLSGWSRLWDAAFVRWGVRYLDNATSSPCKQAVAGSVAPAKQ